MLPVNSRRAVATPRLYSSALRGGFYGSRLGESISLENKTEEGLSASKKSLFPIPSSSIFRLGSAEALLLIGLQRQLLSDSRSML